MDLLNLFVKIGVKDEASEAVEGVSQNIIGKLGKAAATAAKALAGMWAVKKVGEFGKAAFDAYSEFQQLAGGAEKIFDEIDQSKILSDANGAWKNLNMSANEYLAAINQTGAMFAQTMGDEAGYETAKKGMQAISDYATGTGKNINELNDKFSAITRSTSSYQSIADQFAGILPATSKDFLEQAQAAGLLSGKYKELTDVPVAEYQQAVSGMLEKGVADLGLAGNTANEALTTISGSVLATKSAWQNLVTEFGKPDADIGARISDMFTALMGEGGKGGLVRNVVNEVGVIASNMISAVGNGISAAIQYIRDNGPNLLSDAMGSIGDAIERGWTKLLDFRTSFNLVDALFGEDGESGIVGKVGDWLSRMGQAFSDNWPYIQGQLEGLWEELVATVETYAPQLMEVAGRLVTMAGNAIKEHGPEIAAKVSELVQNGLNAIGKFVGMAAAKGAEFIGGLITGTSDEGKKLHEWFANFFPDGLLKGLGDFATFLLDAGKALINGLLDGIGEVAPDVEEAIRGAFQTVIDFFGGVADFISDPIGAIKNGLDSLGGAFSDTESDVSGSMKGVEGSVDRSMGNAGKSLGKYNGIKLTDKKATATVTGNAQDGKAKTSVENTSKAVRNLSGKSISVSASGNVVSGVAESAIRSTKSIIDKLKDKAITVTTHQKTTVSGPTKAEQARGGIRRHARGDIMVANRYTEGVPLDIVGEAGPEAIVPLTSRYGHEFARIMGMEAGKYIGGHMGGGNSYNLYYSGEQSALDMFDDLTFRMQVLEAMGD